MDRSPWVLVWRSDDGRVIVKQHRDTKEVIVATALHSAHFKLDGKRFVLVYST